jgi:hypothetical protein
MNRGKTLQVLPTAILMAAKEGLLFAEAQAVLAKEPQLAAALKA